MAKSYHGSEKFKYLIGVDEAGRGPLAGPVALGAVLIPRAGYTRARRLFRTIRNSKHLSLAARERWYRLMLAARRDGRLAFACAYSSNLAIDRRGLSWAIRSALSRSIRNLASKNVQHRMLNISPINSHVLLDGSLKAPPKYLNQQTIIKGDETEMIIAMASVVAKVRRDRLIRRLAKKYPHYGFEVHVGYGTAAHYRALRRHGLSPLHRRSFLSRVLRAAAR